MLIKHLHTDKIGFNDFASALNSCKHLSLRSDFNLFHVFKFSLYYGDGKLHKIHRLNVSCWKNRQIERSDIQDVFVNKHIPMTEGLVRREVDISQYVKILCKSILIQHICCFHQDLFQSHSNKNFSFTTGHLKTLEIYKWIPAQFLYHLFLKCPKVVVISWL